MYFFSDSFIWFYYLIRVVDLIPDFTIIDCASILLFNIIPLHTFKTIMDIRFWCVCVFIAYKVISLYVIYPSFITLLSIAVYLLEMFRTLISVIKRTRASTIVYALTAS